MMLSSYRNEAPDTLEEKEKFKELLQPQKLGSQKEEQWNGEATNSLHFGGTLDETSDALLLLHLANNEPASFSDRNGAAAGVQVEKEEDEEVSCNDDPQKRKS